MPQDGLEGTAYVLPHTLQWETALEISSFANTSTIKIPISVWSKLIRSSNMVKRATEEEEMVMKELVTMNERLIIRTLTCIKVH